MKNHRHGSRWWEHAVRIELVHYSSRKMAVAAEIQAINTENPTYNVAGRDCAVPPPQPLPRIRPLPAVDEDLINLIADRRQAGLSYQAIADELTASGTPTVTGRQLWYPAQVKRIWEQVQTDRRQTAQRDKRTA